MARGGIPRFAAERINDIVRKCLFSKRGLQRRGAKIMKKCKKNAHRWEIHHANSLEYSNEDRRASAQILNSSLLNGSRCCLNESPDRDVANARLYTANKNKASPRSKDYCLTIISFLMQYIIKKMERKQSVYRPHMLQPLLK